jgi:hypothetical protein
MNAHIQRSNSRREARRLVAAMVGAVGLAGLVAGVLLSTAIGGIARADDFNPDFSRPYTQGSGGDCIHDGVDPVNTEFKGDEARAEIVHSQIITHAAWSNGQGGDQWLDVRNGPNAYSCRQQGYQNASGGDDETRFHIRLWRVPYADNPKKTVGDAHHEDYSHNLHCNFGLGQHAVNANGADGSGFDWGRRNIRGNFIQGGHFTDAAMWGNTANFGQCDQEMAGSNGWGAIIDVGHSSG